MENLAIDENTRNGLGAITNDVNEYIKNLRVNPTTGRLLVDAHLTSTNTGIGDTIPGGTEGSVLFLGLGSTLAQDNANFFWDDTNNYLGLGLNTPAATLDILGTFKYVDGNEANGYVLTSDASGNASWQANTGGGGGTGYNLIQNQGSSVVQQTTINLTSLLTASDVGGKTELDINVANLALDTTFITDLIANSAFTTALAGDNNFLTTLLADTTFIAGIVNIVNTDTSISINLSTQVTGTLGVGNGGTGATTLTGVLVGNGTSAITGTAIAQGDLFYGSAVNTLTALTKDTNATRYLSNQGTSNNPSWNQVNLANGVTGTLPVANGGTGDTSLTAYAVLCGGTTSTNPVQSVASVGTAGQVLTSNGAGALPTFQATPGTLYNVNADESISSWWSYTIPVIGTPITPANTSGIPTSWKTSGNYMYLDSTFIATNAGGIAVLTGQSGVNADLYTNFPGATSESFRFSVGKGFRLKFRTRKATGVFLGVGVTTSIGVTIAASTAYASETSTAVGARLVLKGIAGPSIQAYGVVGNGTTNQNTALSHYDATGVWNLIEIVYTGSVINFYVNGSLDATYNTNLPTSATDALIAIGDSSGNNQIELSSQLVVSLES